jgi:hypothetical protein
MEKRSLKLNQSRPTNIIDSLKGSNISSNGKDILKATIPGKMPIKHMPQI